MKWGLEVVLLTFALVGYVGCGASLAAARYRSLAEGQTDVGMIVVAAMLMLFAGVCTEVAAGVFGVAALGGIITWTSYVAMARQIGMFSIQSAALPEMEPLEQPR